MHDGGVQFVEFGARVVGQNVLIVFAIGSKLGHVVVQMRWLKLTKSDFAQMENGQTGRQILVIRGVGRNQIGRGFNDGFMDVIGAYAVVKLDMGFELHLRYRYIAQTFCRPSDDAVNFIQINCF